MSYSYKGYRGKRKSKPFTGPTKAGIYKSKKENWLKVVAPYKADFVDELKSSIQPSHRSWDPDNKHWLVNEIYLEDLVKMCQRHFDEIETDLVEGATEATEPENLFTQVFNALPNGGYVDKVYYALAQAIHPDHGGSEELMTQLNKAYQERK